MRACGGRAATVGPVEEGEGRRPCRASAHAACPSPCRGDDSAGRGAAAGDATERGCRSLAVRGTLEDRRSRAATTGLRRRRRQWAGRRRVKGVADTIKIAPRGVLSPWRRGKSGAAAPSAWGRTAPDGRRRRRQRRGASAGAVRWRRRIEYGALGGRPALGAGRGFLVLSVAGGQCPPVSPGGGLPSSVSDAVGLHVCAMGSALLLGDAALGGRTVCGGFPGLPFCASMRYWRSPSCGADAAVSDGGGVVLRQRRCTGGRGRCCAEAGRPVVFRLSGVPLRLVSAFGALARVSSSASHVLTAGRVNPDGGVSCIGGNYLHRRYLAARDRAN